MVVMLLRLKSLSYESGMKGIIWKATYVLTCQKIYTVFKKM